MNFENESRVRIVHRVFRGLVLLGLYIVACLFSGSAPSGLTRIAAAAPLVQSQNSVPSITVDVGVTNGNVDPNAFGVSTSNKGNNAPELMRLFRTADGQQALRDLGVKTLNYGADRDDWQNPYNAYTAFPETYPSLMDTNEFLNLNQAINADPMIAVNITHKCRPLDLQAPPSPTNVTCEPVTPTLAKEWLQYIKQSGLRQVKYVQLGAEPYAGCQYWQPGKDINCTAGEYGEHKIALPQEVYAKRVLKWAKVLRKVDPTLKLGIHLQPNTFLCQASCNNISWDETLLKKAGKYIDFVITHQYFIIDAPATTEQEAQRLSYYQEQRDVRVSKQGVTAMPRQIRSELSKWLPSNKNIPIIVGEYNASRFEANESQAVETRLSLYASMAVAKGYLDMLAPVKVKGAKYPGATRVILLDLHNKQVLIARYLPDQPPQTLVYSPAWHMLAMLKDFQGKSWLTAKIKGNTKTSFNRPTLQVYAVKQGKNLWLAVFNHDTTAAQTLDVILAGAKPLSATATVVGDTATSFLAANSLDNPNLIVPTTTNLPTTQIKKDRLSQVVFPPHSLTVLVIHGK